MTSRPPPALRALGAALVVALAGLLSLGVLDMTDEPGGLTAGVSDRLDESGVTHAVTGVLLNFRAYDTWLEVGVLLLAGISVLSLHRVRTFRTAPDRERFSPALSWLVRLVVPLTVIVAGYVLWLGTHAPGGAFQAGAVLAAGLVLLRVAGFRFVPGHFEAWFRAALVLGFAAFLIAAAATVVSGRSLLEYPPAAASTIIVIVELAIAVATGVTLAALFVGARAPEVDDAPASPRE